MKYTLIFFSFTIVVMIVMIGCSQDVTILEAGVNELPVEYIPAIPDSTDNPETTDPEVGGWKPGNSSSTDMKEKEE